MEVTVRRCERDPLRSQRDGASVRHGVPRVDDQIDEHLVDLHGIDESVHGAVRLDDVHPDVLAYDTLEQSARVRQDGVQVDYPRSDHLLPAESQELLDQRCRAVARPADLVGILSPRVPLFELVEEQVGVSDDSSQEVVEVVRDASSESPDRLQFLRVPELLFQLRPLRHLGREGPVGLGDLRDPLLEFVVEERRFGLLASDCVPQNTEQDRQEVHEPEHGRVRLGPDDVSNADVALHQREFEQSCHQGQK